MELLESSLAAGLNSGLASTAQLQRIMRSSLLDVMGQQYITTARAKGLKERDVVMKYGVTCGDQSHDQRLGLGDSQNSFLNRPWLALSYRCRQQVHSSCVRYKRRICILRELSCSL